ncbi:MAG: protein translocase subunit SecF [Desulfobacteraceae bacterium]|nr:protein translocase subunit SecF [Desulfobacteraceae bacterium]
MRFIKPDINLDFIGKRKIAYTLSLGLILLSIVSLISHGGPKYGIDFAGGTLIQVRFETPVKISALKSGLEALKIAGSSVQTFGDEGTNEYLIRTNLSEETGGEGFEDKLIEQFIKSTGANPEIRRVEMVGPQVGKDLQEKALLAIFFSLLFIAVYISGRFELKWTLSGVIAAALMGGVYLLTLFSVSVAFLTVAALIITLILFWFLELKYAMGAIVALIHDVTITVGIFSLLGLEFSLSIVAAILTIIGYSLNDTIIVFDRIRENLQKYPKKQLDLNINKSINETLSRTILTSGTTLMVVVALFLFGGSIIHDFAFALLVGIGVGTYSSIYVASPILLAWQDRKK